MVAGKDGNDTMTDDINIPVEGEKRSRERTCTECGEAIDGDVMIPEGEGPMHTDCWTEWMKDYDE